MKRTALKKTGKKSKQWVKDRAKLIKEAVAEGRITIEHGYPEGRCEDCGHWHKVDPDHKLKRSQGGPNDKPNIDWVCNEAPCYCHTKRDNMPDSKKQKGKKPNWAVAHNCKKCRRIVSTLICSYCSEMSV